MAGGGEKLNPQRGAARGGQFVGARAVDAHRRYLQRDGVTRRKELGLLGRARAMWRMATPSSTGAAMTATTSSASRATTRHRHRADRRPGREEGLDGVELGERGRLVIDGRLHQPRDGRRPRRGSRPKDDHSGRVHPFGAARRGPQYCGGRCSSRPPEHLGRSRAAVERIGGGPHAFTSRASRLWLRPL